jgi:hypothetical protein
MHFVTVNNLLKKSFDEWLAVLVESLQVIGWDTF